jgi:hypothetical protein
MELEVFFTRFALLFVGLILGGCASIINDVTPGRMPKNQSRIYTMSMSINKTGSELAKKGLKPYIIVNGERHEMKNTGGNIFEYDHKVPDEVSEIPYYYELVSETSGDNNVTYSRSVEKSKLFNLSISDKYIMTLDCKRGPVGARVCILGSGFSQRDMFRIGRIPARVNSISKGVMEFTIPFIDAETSYDIILVMDNKKIFVNRFFVDISTLSTDVDAIRLNNGEKMLVSFFIDHDAPRVAWLWISQQISLIV